MPAAALHQAAQGAAVEQQLRNARPHPKPFKPLHTSIGGPGATPIVLARVMLPSHRPTSPPTPSMPAAALHQAAQGAAVEQQLRNDNPLYTLLRSLLPWVNVGQEPDYAEGGAGPAGGGGGQAGGQGGQGGGAQQGGPAPQ